MKMLMTNQKKNVFSHNKKLAKDFPNKNNNKNKQKNMKLVSSLFKCGRLW